MATSIRGQLLALGVLDRAEAMVSPPRQAERSPKPANEAPSQKPPKKKPRPQPAKKAVKSPTPAKKGKSKAAKAAAKHFSAPSFKTRGAPVKPRPATQAAVRTKPNLSPPRAGPKAQPAITPAAVDRLIESLPDRTMLELRPQWLNAIEKGDHPEAVRFRKALLSEWHCRACHATTPADWFKWPSTRGGDGMAGADFSLWYEQGKLKYLGYQVGITEGRSRAARRHILEAVFSSGLPPVNDAAYVRGWGSPGTAARLRRLAEEIARFLRNAKSKRSANMGVAISDWEEDLRYLHERYDKGRFHFAWP